jgi:N-acetylglucosaminyl-diphospho-decaprenol L-rhamnosyltransferase
VDRQIDVSVIIINYKSAAFTKECLRSIFADTKESSLEVIVIDNASYDGCGELIATEFPQVTFVQSTRNLGFAQANNLGVTIARGKCVLFLNPDTEIRASAIESLRTSLESIPDAGMVGARLLNSDLSLQTTSITAFPSILNQTLGTETLRRRFPYSNLWGIRPLFENHQSPVLVDAISGACMMAKREVIERVQGFTSDYFMYAEDLDLCLKVKKAGWSIYYVPDAVIVHHGGQSSGSRSESDFAAIMIRQSLFLFMQRHRGWWYAWLFRGTTAFVAIYRLTLLTLALPAAGILSARRSIFGAWGKWFRILGWCFGLQSWVSRERSHPGEFSNPVSDPEPS